MFCHVSLQKNHAMFCELIVQRPEIGTRKKAIKRQVQSLIENQASLTQKKNLQLILNKKLFS